ncbi:hypothetical protein [Acidianus manzaensis]|uniref:Amino acid permease n=1 Tax=Acidianus manzaensis TaxID=282676 RepID=A0A1W6JZI1_9CREN|nr:hypothetical protein [Acidianus manzaensis]ARM75620.1 hypothetical protein B6F84_05925 [Acidianus manzaensis]
MYFARKTSGLLKELSSFDVFMLNLSFMGAIAGISYPLYVASTLPKASWLIATVLGSIMVLPLIVNYYLISIKYNRTSADYVFVSRKLGGFIGTVMAMALYTSFAMGFPVLSMLEIIYVIVPGLQAIGASFHIPYLINLANDILSTNLYLFVTALLFSSLSFILSLRRLYFKSINYLTIMEIISTIIIIFSLIFGKLNVGDKVTFIHPFNLQSVVLAQIFILSYFAFINAPAYYAGEVKKTKKTMFYGYFGAWIATFLMSVFIILSIELSIGKAYFLEVETQGWNLPILPNSILPFAFASVLNIPILVLILFITSISWYLLYAMQNFTMSTRLLFSLSFDRILPDFLSNVKGGMPANATIISFIVSLFFSFIEIYLGFSISFAVDGLWFIIWSYLLVSIASIKENKVIAILSSISMIFTAFITIYYGLINPSFGTLIFAGNTSFDLLTIIIPPIVGVITYVISKSYRKKQKINIDMNFKEIPPE